jgi:hypothetical protein
MRTEFTMTVTFRAVRESEAVDAYEAVLVLLRRTTNVIVADLTPLAPAVIDVPLPDFPT